MAVEAQTIPSRDSAGWRRFLPLLLMAALAAQVWVLVRDLGPEPRRDGARGEPVAELAAGRGAVKVQDPGSLVWDEIPPGETLFRRQSLLTADDGRAELAFVDGLGVILGANTLIEVDRVDGAAGPLTLTLLRGRARTRDARAGLELRVGNSRVRPAPGSALALHAESAAGGAIQVLSGSAELSGPSGVASSAVAGEEIVVASAGASEAPASRKAAFTLLAPRDDDRRPAPAGTSSDVAFEWAIDVAQVSDSPMQLEVSRDETFARDVRTGVVNASYPPMERARLELRLPAGERAERWYWRVRALRRAHVSAVERFQLGPGPRPAPRLPESGSTVRGGRVDFAWSPVEHARSYEVEVRPEQGEALRATVSRAYARIEGIAAGRYRWRVRAAEGVSTDGRDWSSEREFRVLGPDETPPPPRLHEPEFEVPGTTKSDARRQTQPGWWERLLPVAHAAESEDAVFYIRLRWDAVPGAGSYRLQISRRSTFDETIVNTTLREAQWTWPYRRGMENSRGRVFYRVASIGADGRESRFSEARPISIPEALRGPRAATPIVRAPEPERYGAVESEAAPTGATAAAPPIAAVAAGRAGPPRATAHFRTAASVETISQNRVDADQGSVSLAEPYLTPRLGFTARTSRHWTDLELAGVGFRDPASDPRAPQPSHRFLSVRATALASARITRGWNLLWGVTLERGDRWVRDGAAAVAASSGTALGAAGMAVRESARNETGLRLTLPLTGLLLGGQTGASIAGWREWRFLSIGQGELGLRVGAQYEWLRWSAPSGAITRAWAFYVGPAWRQSLF